MDVTSRAAGRRASAASGRSQIALGAVLWGTAGVSGRVAAAAGSPALLTATARTVVAAVLVAAVVAISRVPGLPRRRGVLPAVAAVGVLLAVYQTAYFAAVELAGVTVATLVALGVAPVLVAVAAPLVGDARADRGSWVTIVVALVGLVLLVGGAGATAPVGGSVIVGALLALLCAGGFAGVNLLGRTLRDVAPLRLIAVAFGIGGVLQALALVAVWPLPTIAPSGLAALVYVGVVPTALAYALFFRGIAVVRAHVAAVTALLEPVTAAVLAVVLLGERLAPTGWVGALIVLAALAALGLRERPAPTPRPGDRPREVSPSGTGSA